MEEDNLDNNEHWMRIKDALNTTCEEILGRQKQTQKEWISAQTFRKIQTRKEKKAAVNNSRTRTAKAAAQAEYTIVNKEVKKSIKNDKRNYVENLAKEAEQAAGSRNMKQLYDISKKLATRKRQAERPIKDRYGKTLSGAEQQLNRWAEHFEELLNRPSHQHPPDIPEMENDLPISCDPPTSQEIRAAILKAKNGKAAGPDGIPSEALKADLDTTVEMLQQLFKKILKDENIPENWKEGHIIKIPKKRRSKSLREL